MITLVLTNRNRELKLVKRCLASLEAQTNKNFKITFVDYGSREDKLNDLKILISQYPAIKYVSCDTSNQLWCKSRAINIVLKQCETTHFFVGDIDMMFHPECIEKLHLLKNKADAVYFQVGFLSEVESKKDKEFHDFKVNFNSTNEATGITIYNTEILKSINGYDEFYHGWGSEDTDVHIRLRNAGKEVLYFDETILMLHQWHPKIYRSQDSTEPFHSNLEKINHKYLAFSESIGKVRANEKFDWGFYDDDAYKQLESSDFEINITNELSDFKGFVNNVMLGTTNKVFTITIKNHKEYKSLKHVAKKVLCKKVNAYLEMQEINNILLETIISNCRNAPHKYIFDTLSQQISLIIKL